MKKFIYITLHADLKLTKNRLEKNIFSLENLMFTIRGAIFYIASQQASATREAITNLLLMEERQCGGKKT